MSTFKYISKELYSNCFIQAIKAKIHDRTVKLYFCRPRFVNGRFQMFHFMWSDGTADYDFSDLTENCHLPWYKCFIFKGRIRMFPKGFAEKYSKTERGK